MVVKSPSMKIFPKTAGGNFVAAFSSFLFAGCLQNGFSDTLAAVLAVYGFINLVMSVVRYVRWVFGSSENEKPYEVNVDVTIVEIRKETKP